MPSYNVIDSTSPDGQISLQLPDLTHNTNYSFVGYLTTQYGKYYFDSSIELNTLNATPSITSSVSDITLDSASISTIFNFAPETNNSLVRIVLENGGNIQYIPLDNAILEFFRNTDPVLGAFYATLFTWGLTALGASLVFFVKEMNRALLDGLLGFTGGVMVAASFWSLLAPGIEMSPGEGFIKVIPASIGFGLGALFIFSLDKVLPHIHINFKESEGIKTPWHKTTLLVLAITLHNIPEGLAVGVLFGGVAAGIPEASIAGAVALAIGIGIQNFPEGIAVSMPMRRQGVSRFKSFWYGQLSAIVEPIAAVIGALAVTFFTPILPYALAFAAGAMIFVVVEEVIPETQQDRYTDIATLGFIGGFIVMMSLDVALG
jgi:ZIP family zinc transporter